MTGDPTYQTAGVASATFTFSADKAAQAAAAAGEVLPPAPAGIDGSKLRLQAGPGVAAGLVAAHRRADARRRPGRRATVDSSGVPFTTVRDYLLSLPGLPDGLADAAPATFSADGGTLPLPVPAELATTSEAVSNGATATVLTSRDRALRRRGLGPERCDDRGRRGR